MKKFKLINFILLFIFICTISSCKSVSHFNGADYGKINYYVAGVYLEVEKYDEALISDNNPKIYFNFSDPKYFGYFKTTTGNATSAINYFDTSKNIIKDNGVNKYRGEASFKVLNENVKKINLYLIYISKDGTITINTDLKDTLKVENNENYDFFVKFKFQKENYEIQLKLVIKK